MKKFSNKLFRLLKSDIKDLNSVVLSLIGTFVLVGATILAYNLNSSFALFSYETSSDKILKMSPGFSLDESGANAPVLSGNMIPVYYDSDDNIWRKADSANLAEDYQWYDYDSKMWANSVTVSDSYKNTKARDLTMYEKNGELKGSVISSDGLSFDGVDDYVLMPSNLGVSFPASYSVKFKTSSTENQIIFGDHTTGAGLGLYNSNNGLIVSLNTSTTVFNTGGLEQNKLYTVDIVYNSLTNVKAYLNGKELSSSGAQNHWSWEDSNNYLGRRSSGTNFKGVIEKFIVYDDILTIDEINYNLSVDNSFVGGKGVIADNLKLYYNFKMNPREYYLNSSLGTAVSMDDILTMQVWIPRYKYTVWNYNSDGSATSNPQQINVTFENGYNTTGEISCKDKLSGSMPGDASEECKFNNAVCTDATCNGKTYTHPAFTFGEEELEGFWVGKFEVGSLTECLSGSGYDVGCACNLPTMQPISKPNVFTWQGAMVGTFDYVVRGMNDGGNIYGFKRNTDTHVIKNMEWGAVSYLTYSKYGINGEVALNSFYDEYYDDDDHYYILKFMTGCGPQSVGSYSQDSICNDYVSNLGKSASTTGNVYGVYDMSGGAAEYTMANLVSQDTKTMVTGWSTLNFEYSGFSGMFSNRQYGEEFYESYYEYPNSRYLDKYSYASEYTRIISGKLGDSTKELYSGIVDGYRYYSWYDGSYSMPNYKYPWYLRGDYGMNDVDNGSGDASGGSPSSRVVIVPNSIETIDNKEINISNPNCRVIDQ